MIHSFASPGDRPRHALRSLPVFLADTRPVSNRPDTGLLFYLDNSHLRRGSFRPSLACNRPREITTGRRPVVIGHRPVQQMPVRYSPATVPRRRAPEASPTDTICVCKRHVTSSIRSGTVRGSVCRFSYSKAILCTRFFPAFRRDAIRKFLRRSRRSSWIFDASPLSMSCTLSTGSKTSNSSDPVNTACTCNRYPATTLGRAKIPRVYGNISKTSISFCSQVITMFRVKVDC